MKHHTQKHEKIRFRRHEISDLAAMPSAEGQEQHWKPAGMRPGSRRIALTIVGGLVAVVSLCVAAVMVIAMSGWGSERLRAEAEKAIERLAGVPVSASVGPARITFDGTRFLALELNDIGVNNTGADRSMLQAGMMRFGIRLLPLLTGDVQLGSAKISDARVDVGAMPTSARIDWTTTLRDERGLIEPDKVAAAVFGQVNAVMNVVEKGSARGLELENVDFIVPEGRDVRTIRIVSGSLAESAPGTLSMAASADIDGRLLSITGTAVRDMVSRRIISLDLTVAGQPMLADAQAPPEASMSQLGGFSVAVSGNEGLGSGPPKLDVTATLERSVLDLGARGAFTGNMSLDLTLVGGSGKIEIDRLLLETGRNHLEFNGAIGPRPATQSENDSAAYRFELVSTKTVLAPQESPEPPLDFGVRIAGTFDQAAKILLADEIAIRNGSGEALGTARVELVEGKAPGISFALEVKDMQVAHVKQLWPWFSAPKARQWVFNHVFGGRVNTSRIELRVQPGRLGNGVPLSGEEVTARFDIRETRFDTAGLIPPVRDADGIVEVSGNDIDVSLSKGTVFLPSGRSVEGTNGTLSVKRANIRPVIGKLEIDIAGDAKAVTELASYDPINAMKRIGMTADEFSGEVSGHVTADIPFQKDTDPKTLDWLVALDFTDLAVTKPFDGQIVTDASGKITVWPDHAVIDGKGKFNGVPAEFDVVEPLRPEGPERERKVALVLDDKARNLLAPGLAGLVSGPVKVQLDSRDGVRHFIADLSNAKLDLPWIGWSKGAGIGASAEFSMAPPADGVVTLSDFSLSGKTFAAKGKIALADGKLSTANFGSVRLNRGDDVSVAIKRTAKGYDVNVDGASLDARAMLKKVTSGEQGDDGDKPTSVALKLDVAALGGFNGETLSDVKLSYTGTGASPGGLTVAAKTGSGGTVAVKNGEGGGGRSLELNSTDAGGILRFLDIYKHVQGGSIKLTLAGSGGGSMAGQIDARSFVVVNEPKLASIVSTTPPGDERSLNQAVRKDIDTSKVQFERGFAQIEKGPGSLRIANGVLRGPLIGTTFQGTLYDAKGNMDMTGTFMPAYGLNRLFGELPLIGVILGNGRDRGLIGVTYQLKGDAKSPKLQINPLSVIAPGIFRSIFEF